MARALIFDADARRAIKEGVDMVADVVKVTIGPKGRNVILQGPGEPPLISNDGATIAGEIELEDSARNLGVSTASCRSRKGMRCRPSWRWSTASGSIRGTSPRVSSLMRSG